MKKPFPVTFPAALLGVFLLTGVARGQSNFLLVNVMTNGSAIGGTATNWSMLPGQCNGTNVAGVNSPPNATANVGAHVSMLFNSGVTNLTSISGHIYSTALNVTNGLAYTVTLTNSTTGDIRLGDTNIYSFDSLHSVDLLNWYNPVSGVTNFDLVYLTNGSSLTLSNGNLGGGTPLTLNMAITKGWFNISSNCTFKIMCPIINSSKPIQVTGGGLVVLDGIQTNGNSLLIQGFSTVRVASPSALSTNITSLTGTGSSSSPGTLDLGSPGNYVVTNISVPGLLGVTASGGAATLSVNGASGMSGTANKQLDVGTNASVIFNAPVDVSPNAYNTNGGRNLVLSGAGNVTFSNSITLNAPVPTNVFGLFVSGTVKTTLTAVNTYNGDTTVSGGTLVLGAASSIANSTNIVIGGSGTLDVSAAGLVLGANRSFLNTSNGATATGTIVGNLSASAGTLTMFYNSGVPAFNITNGTFSLSSSTVVNVTNNGAALTAASYKLISKSSTGLPGTVSAGSLPAVTVGGNGLASGASASLAVTSGELYLVVSGGTLTPPVVATNSVSLTGGKMVFSFSGVSGQTWNILTSTNAALPLSSWTTNFSGTFSGSAVSFTNSSSTDSQRFYIIKSP